MKVETENRATGSRARAPVWRGGALLAAGLLLAAVQPAAARGSHASHAYASRGSHRSSAYAQGVKRDSHGRIERSSSAKHEFERRTGYPHGRPGYVVDHIVPLSRGGSDTPENMQWQAQAEAKAKDRVERGSSTSGSRSRHRRR